MRSSIHSKPFIYGIIVGLAIGLMLFMVLQANLFGGTSAVVNVTGVRILYYNVNTREFNNGGTLSGFTAGPGSTYSYNFTVIYRNASYNETIQDITTFNKGFGIAGTYPQLPEKIRALSNQSFVLSILLPQHAYYGELNITVMYAPDYRNVS